MSALPEVSSGRAAHAAAAARQKIASVPSAIPGYPRATKSTARKGDTSAPILDIALFTPSPNVRTRVGKTCSMSST